MTTLRWTGPTKNTDGSVFDEAQYAGFELEVDQDGLGVAVPVAWDNDNQYEFPLSTLSYSDGNHTVRMRTVNKAGRKSAWSNPATFTLARTPDAPTNLTASA